MVISELIAIFLKHVGETRKPATVKQYRQRLKLFADRFGSRELATLTPLEVEDYLADAGRWPAGHPHAGEQKSPDTRRANAIAFQQLQGFAKRHREIPALILDEIDKPAGRERDRLPTEAETNAILAEASPAFRLIYSALRQSGARPNELARARIEDIDQGLIVLADHKTASKTGKPRTIAIGKKLGDLIRKGIGTRTTGPIFLSPNGRPWTAAGISATYRRIRDRLQLPRDLCLYLARHEHATKLCKEKGIHAAAAALGHAKITTTQRYVKTDAESLRDNQDLVDL